MGVIYTTGWTREAIRSGYQNWFDSLESRAEVCLQTFQPPRDSLGFPFETWRFEIGYIYKGENSYQFRPKYGSEPTPYILEDGSATYYTMDQEWGNVFPGRIVPNSHDLEIRGDGKCANIGHMPIYEPFYLYQTRSVIKVPFGREYHKRLHSVMDGRRCYNVEVDGAYLVHIFDEEPLEQMEGFLYSQYIKD